MQDKNRGEELKDDETIEEFIELDQDGEELSGKDTVKKLREKIKKLEEEKQDYLDSWQRALADYKNREAQIEKEKKEWGNYAVKRFAEELLIVMDTYDSARSNVSAWESVDQNWRGGIEYIFSSFENKLKEQGFEKFGKVGDEFDPNLHEGLEVIDTDDKSLDNKIAQVIMSGYKYKDNVWRAAKVKAYKLK
ncbi:MAG: molecular chaperone GrpE [Patescibacteria group bacterium]|nr:molecular chaperone GrpE [Patescibacteria group bacterium]